MLKLNSKIILPIVRMEVLFRIDVDIHRYALNILLMASWMDWHGRFLLCFSAASGWYDFLIDVVIKVIILITAYTDHCRI